MYVVFFPLGEKRHTQVRNSAAAFARTLALWWGGSNRSPTRRIFTTVGVDPQIEFVDTDFETPPTQSRRPVYRTYDRAPDTAALIVTILSVYQLGATYENLPRDVRLVAERIDARIEALGAARGPMRAEVAAAVFYRSKGAYFVGRIPSGPHSIPLALALFNTPQGIIVDAVLLRERKCRA